MSAWFYMLRLRSGLLYPGATTDLERRWREHLEGKACRTTERDLPVELAHTESFPTFVQARRREAQVKRWSLAKKEALAAGDVARLKALAKRRSRRA
jgi:predicted GIY-YIG superfamily endonuclease